MCDVADVAYEYSYEDDGWGDKLTNYNYFDPYLLKPRVYYPITYDAMGNMTSFNGSTMTWTAGRQLSSLTTADGELYSFTYNENGYLSEIEKSVDGAVEYTEHYTWNGEKLINYRKVEGYWVDESYILYDEQGEAYGLIRNEIMVYLFNRNLQGDITEIIEPDFGFVGAEYYYDAYGNYTVKDPESSWYSGDLHAKYVDEAVPFTYRGYLDINIGDYHLYYLGSRFYSPQLGRFINADKHVDTGTGVIGTNMYAYCNNNPVMFVDPTGESIRVTMKLTNLIVKVISSISVSINSRKRNQKAVQILKDLDIYPYYLRKNKKKYNPYVILKTDGMSEQIFTIYLSVSGNFYAPAMKIDATFEERTIQEWKQYVAQSLLDMILNDSVLLQTVYGLMSTHGDLISFLREFASGKIQTGAFYLDFINFLFSIMSTVKIGKQKYIIKQLEEFGYNKNPNEKMIILLYYSRYSPYDKMDKSIVYMY